MANNDNQDFLQKMNTRSKSSERLISGIFFKPVPMFLGKASVEAVALIGREDQSGFKINTFF